MAYALARHPDPRLVLMTGLGALATAAALNIDLDPLWAADQFRASMVFLGAGRAPLVYALLLFATAGMGPVQGPTAGTLFNLTRIIGQAFGAGFIAALVTERAKFHSNMLGQDVAGGAQETATRLAKGAAAFATRTSDPDHAAAQAVAALRGQVADQTYVLAYAGASPSWLCC